MTPKQRALFIFLTTLALGAASFFYVHRKPKVGDVELNIKAEYQAPGAVMFEGTIMNTGDADIEECVIGARISGVKFEDEALSNCEMVSTIATVRNLKARETRDVVWYFNHDDSHLEKIPAGYNDGAAFTYTVYWTPNFRWRLSVAGVK
ncbi:MAG TPA: hypothetical protein VGX48_01205 [Pyrinomonadaceae bacterium]|jgi:hypothetical protein|nr:hypothetical protein [Pyrinomonadaceae bacterium]